MPLVRRYVRQKVETTSSETIVEHIFYLPPARLRDGDEIVPPTDKQLEQLAVIYPDEYLEEAEARGIRPHIRPPDADAEDDMLSGDELDIAERRTISARGVDEARALAAKNRVAARPEPKPAPQAAPAPKAPAATPAPARPLHMESVEKIVALAKKADAKTITATLEAELGKTRPRAQVVKALRTRLEKLTAAKGTDEAELGDELVTQGPDGQPIDTSDLEDEEE